MTHLIPGIILTALAIQQGAAPSRQAAETEALKQLETVWNEAHLHSDADALDRLWANDLEVAVPRMPVMTKAEALAFARSGKMAFQSYETSDLRIRVYGDAALVTGRLRRTRTRNGQAVDDDWRFTKVYIRHGGQWQVAAFHASEAARP